MLKTYIKYKWKTIAVVLISLGLYTVVAALYGLSFGGCLYSLALGCFIGLIFFFYGFYNYVQRVHALENIRLNILFEHGSYPKAQSKEEEEYQQIIELLYEKYRSLKSSFDRKESDMVDYYTMWVHQIKTPIAALDVMIQTLEFPEKELMKMELFKTQQYVDMVLQYLRLGSDQSDFLFREQKLDPIIRECVKKFSSSFIAKKLSLEYEPIDTVILSDEKWIAFVLDQILSNSIKYTQKGKISIYMDELCPNVLVIEDTGIGIQEEDIPRVFDKGYTGYNGRNHKKSTGIGLYLCHQILEKLGHFIWLESKAGEGTKVKIDFGYEMKRFE